MIPTSIFPFPAPAMLCATTGLAAPAQADYVPTPFRALCRTVRRRRRHRRRRCRHRRTNRSRLRDELMMTVHAGRPAVMMPLNYICIWLIKYVRVIKTYAHQRLHTHIVRAANGRALALLSGVQR
uniref:Uncharacterized protein n=2 Tax=Oryza TaxID=4527 RepID=A0A0D3GI96_9ORYZ